MVTREREGLRAEGSARLRAHRYPRRGHGSKDRGHGSKDRTAADDDENGIARRYVRGDRGFKLASTTKVSQL